MLCRSRPAQGRALRGVVNPMTTVISRRYTPAGLSAVRGKVNALLRKAHKKGWNADITIEAGEPFLYTIDDAVRGKFTVYYVDATITFTGHFAFEGDWALVAVADARATDEPLIFLLDEEFEMGDVDLKRCDHCGRRAARKRAYFIRSAAGEVKQVGGSCAHEFLGVNLFSAISLHEAVEVDPDEEFSTNYRTEFDTGIVLDAAIRAYTAFGYAKRDAEHALPTKEIVTAMLTGWFWHHEKFAEYRTALANSAEPRITREELREWMLEQTGSFGHNLAVIARSENIKKDALGIAAYAPAGFDDWRGKMAEAAKRREEEEARRANAESVPVGRVTVEGTVQTIRFFENDYGCGYKMRVVTDTGWAVWGTVPRGLSGVEVDDRVRFDAEIMPSEDDRSFGFFKRPTKAEFAS